MTPAVTSGRVRSVVDLHSPDRQHSQTMDLSSLPVEVIAAILAHVPIKVSRTTSNSSPTHPYLHQLQRTCTALASSKRSGGYCAPPVACRISTSKHHSSWHQQVTKYAPRSSRWHR